MDREIITQSKLLLMCLQLILKSGIRPDMTPGKWLEILLFLHTQGWLFCGMENGKLAVVTAGYRVKEAKEDQMNTLPEKEEGTILYIPFLVSFAIDQMLPTKMLQQFLRKQENKDITEVLIEDRNDQIIRRKVFKGEENGEKQTIGVAENAGISTG